MHMHLAFGRMAPSPEMRQKGKERKGKERKGKERKGTERKGKERKGKERKGKESCDKSLTCHQRRLLMWRLWPQAAV